MFELAVSLLRLADLTADSKASSIAGAGRILLRPPQCHFEITLMPWRLVMDSIFLPRRLLYGRLLPAGAISLVVGLALNGMCRVRLDAGACRLRQWAYRWGDGGQLLARPLGRRRDDRVVITATGGYQCDCSPAGRVCR